MFPIRPFLAAVLAAAGAAAAEPTVQELQQEIDSLSRRLVELQAGQLRLSDERVADTIRAVLDDADRRSQLFAAEGFTAGWQNGFILRSADGNYLLKLGTLFQVRSVTSYRDDVQPDGDADTQSGFEIKRAQIIANGNVFTPDLTFNFMWESPQSGSMGLLDAYLTYKFAPAWAFKVGQYFDPTSRETLNGPPRRLAVEPSLVDFYLIGGNSDRIQGASLIYGVYQKDVPIFLELAMHDGAKSRNTTFEDGQGSGNWGVAGRLEAKAFGDWASNKDMTAAANKEDLLVFGAGADFTEFDNVQQLLATADAQWEVGKWALFASLNIRHRDFRNTADDGSQLDYGALAQAAYLFAQRWEAFGRYGYIHFDEPPAAGDDTIHEICGGVNWYLEPSAPHRAKMTIDVTWLPNGGGPGAKGFGVIGGTDETEIVVRGQFQLFL